MATAIAQASGDRPVLRGDTSVSPADAVGQVDDLTKQILLKEIELQRYNLHYTMEVAKQGRWKRLALRLLSRDKFRYGLVRFYHLGGKSRSGTGEIVTVKLHPQLAANYIPMIGSIIGASAAAGEFGINAYHEMMARANGFSPAAAVRKSDSIAGRH